MHKGPRRAFRAERGRIWRGAAALEWGAGVVGDGRDLGGQSREERGAFVTAGRSRLCTSSVPVPTLATHGGWSVIVKVEAPNPGLAWRTTAGALDEAISAIGMPPWPIVRVEVVRTDVAWQE